MIESIRFYSGYEYATQVDGLLNCIETAIQSYNQFPDLFSQTARQVMQQQPNPFQGLIIQELRLNAAKRNLERTTASLSWLVRKIAQLAQTLVFYWMGAYRHDGRIWVENGVERGPFTAKLKQRIELASQRSCGTKIAERRIGAQIANIYVLISSPYPITKICLKTENQQVSIQVKILEDREQNKYLACEKLQSSNQEELNQVLLHILTELAFREENIAYLKYNGDVPSILTAAGFHSSAELGGAVLFPGSLRHPHLAFPYLPGQGPFLPALGP